MREKVSVPSVPSDYPEGGRGEKERVHSQHLLRAARGCQIPGVIQLGLAVEDAAYI